VLKAVFIEANLDY